MRAKQAVSSTSPAQARKLLSDVHRDPAEAVLLVDVGLRAAERVCGRATSSGDGRERQGACARERVHARGQLEALPARKGRSGKNPLRTGHLAVGLDGLAADGLREAADQPARPAGGAVSWARRGTGIGRRRFVERELERTSLQKASPCPVAARTPGSRTRARPTRAARRGRGHRLPMAGRGSGGGVGEGVGSAAGPAGRTSNGRVRAAFPKALPNLGSWSSQDFWNSLPPPQ